MNELVHAVVRRFLRILCRNVHSYARPYVLTPRSLPVPPANVALFPEWGKIAPCFKSLSSI